MELYWDFSIKNNLKYNHHLVLLLSAYEIVKYQHHHHLISSSSNIDGENGEGDGSELR